MLIIVHHLKLLTKKTKIFLESSDGPTQGNNDFSGSAEKQISINFSKASTIFCVSLQYIADESYLHVNKIGICKFKTKDNINKDEHKISLNGTAYDSSVGHSSI